MNKASGRYGEMTNFYNIFKETLQ